MKRVLKIFWVILFVAGAAHLAHAGDTPGKSSMVLDRVSLALTGIPATRADKESYLSGRVTLDQLMERYRKDPRFELQLAQFWNEVLKFDHPADFQNITTRRKGELNPDGKYRSFHNFIAAGAALSADGIHRTCMDDPKNPAINDRGYEWSYRISLKPANIDEATSQALYECGCRGDKGVVDGKCLECNTIDINPYWDPTQTVRVCKLLVSPQYCGANLEKCWPDEYENILYYLTQNQLFDNLAYGYTMEPGMLIGKIVAADRPWSDVITTTDTVINSSQAFLLANTTRGKAFAEMFMARPDIPAYLKEATTSPIYTKADVKNYEKFDIVKGDTMAAGVLKTLAFHRFTNGLRAKANRAREGFLCKQYVAPNEPQVNDPEPDLAKRKYCSHCHKSLEPLTKFFGKWPNNDNFNFDETLDDKGSYEGTEGQGVDGLAQIWIDLPEFNECAVRRAFEFVVRREMSEKESESLIGALVNDFIENDRKLWPVIKKIINSPEFMGIGTN